MTDTLMQDDSLQNINTEEVNDLLQPILQKKYRTNDIGNLARLISVLAIYRNLIAHDEKEPEEKISKWSEGKMIEPDLRKRIQTYINNFRTAIGRELHSEIGQKFSIVTFPAGVAIDIEQSPFIANEDIFIGSVSSISDAFTQLSKKLDSYYEGEQLKEMQLKFERNERLDSGTELYFGKTLFVMKGKEEEFWTAKEAKSDVVAILKHFKDKIKAKK